MRLPLVADWWYYGVSEQWLRRTVGLLVSTAQRGERPSWVPLAARVGAGSLVVDPLWPGYGRLGAPSMEGCVMSIVVRFNPTSLTAEKYDEAIQRIEAAGTFPPDGLDYHVCFGSEGNLRVSEIWDSREQLAEFGERLMPILAAAGIEFTSEPEVFEVHNIIKR
jgi:hypothetical protein